MELKEFQTTFLSENLASGLPISGQAIIAGSTFKFVLDGKTVYMLDTYSMSRDTREMVKNKARWYEAEYKERIISITRDTPFCTIVSSDTEILSLFLGDILIDGNITSAS